MNYPKSLEKLIEFYKSLPGIGEKNALRMALSTIEMSDKKLEEFSLVVKNIKNEINKCSICGNLTDDDICPICNDEKRDKNLICVLEDYKSLFSFEKNQIYNGTYHVLGGVISPLNDINPQDLNIDSLVKRVKNNKGTEVIIALPSSMEGEMTMLYLKELLSKYDCKVTRLSHGIPLGMSLEYMDVLSINKALEDRREIES